MGRYFIGQGTGTVKDFDTLDEMFAFHKQMQPIDRHFCKLYDSVRHMLIDGWAIGKDYSLDNPNWRENHIK